MKMLIIGTILCVSACLSSPVKAEKTPPKTPCELENAQMRALIVAADDLRLKAQLRIAFLTSQVEALTKARTAEGNLSAYDAQKQASALQEIGECKAYLQEADRVFALARSRLPRRYQKLAAVSPAALLTCYDDYIARLQRRAWRTGVGGALIGFIGALVIVL